MWRTAAGIHMLTHSMLKDRGLAHKKKRGGYAFSPDGVSWDLSTEEAWDVHLSFDDCGGQHLGKRQRGGLVFDVNTGQPTHFVSGVSTSTDGVRWGDGWTVSRNH